MTIIRSAHKRQGRIAKGSYAGLWGPVKSPRIAISWPVDLLERLCKEANKEGIPFAAVVRRRIRASYFLKPAVMR